MHNALCLAPASEIKQTIQKDIATKRTSYGIHRDDLLLGMSPQESFKDFASQGQRKTLLFALKIAQYQYIKQQLGITPILLLDDVFEKLYEKYKTKSSMPPEIAYIDLEKVNI